MNHLIRACNLLIIFPRPHVWARVNTSQLAERHHTYSHTNHHTFFFTQYRRNKALRQKENAVYGLFFFAAKILVSKRVERNSTKGVEFVYQEKKTKSEKVTQSVILLVYICKQQVKRNHPWPCVKDQLRECVSTRTWNDLKPPTTTYNHLQPPQKFQQPPQKHQQPLANYLKPSETRHKCPK